MVAPEHPSEIVFVLERTAHGATPVEYAAVVLNEKAAEAVLTRAETDGYRARRAFRAVP